VAGKRQHDIPRLLLKGFASRCEDDKVFIWQFRKDAPPPNREFSLRDVGPSKNFYGQSGPETLDDFITLEIEPRHTEFLIRVRREHAIHSLADENIVIDLVHSIVIRTKNFRDRFENLSKVALEKLEPIFTDADAVRRWFMDEVRKGSSAGDEILTAYVKHRYGVKASERKYFKWSKKGELARWLHTSDSEELLKKMTAAAKPQFSDVKSQIPELSKTSHNDTLKKTFQLNTEKESPRYKRYMQMRWTVQIAEGEPLILGDIAVLQYVRKTGEFSAGYDGLDGDIILLPISPKLLIVGTLEDTGALPSAAEINYHSAALSIHYFVASQHTEREREYQNIIGNIALQVPKTW
jgi:Protein of unknown function (DUF4238)